MGGTERLPPPKHPGLLVETWVPLKDPWEKGSDRNSGNGVPSCCEAASLAQMPPGETWGRISPPRIGSERQYRRLRSRGSSWFRTSGWPWRTSSVALDEAFILSQPQEFR